MKTNEAGQHLAGKDTDTLDRYDASSADGGARPPQGLLRLLFRLPVWLYRLGLGWLLGQRFLLINHEGRKSGKTYKTVVEVARRDPQAGTYVVASAYGPQADWYRNLRHNPEVTIQVGRRRLQVRAHFLSPEESGQEMVDYARRHPTAARNLMGLIGYDVEETPAGYRELGREHIPFVAFRSREQGPEGQTEASTAKSLTLFFLLAFALSWLVELPLALKAQGLWQAPFPFSLHYLAAYGPLLAALIATAASQGRQGLQDLFRRIFRWRVSPLWWFLAVSPLLFYGLVASARWLVQGQAPDLALLGQLNFLPPLGLAALPFWIVTFGLGEETGWRGFALPRLQQRYGPLKATAILWFFWALWHLPLFFYTYDAAILPGFLLGLLAGAIVFTWLYNSTGGSILIVAVWHGAFNLTTACTACGDGVGAATVSALVMVWAVLLVILNRPLNLSKAQGQPV